jgi:TolB-like protein
MNRLVLFLSLLILPVCCYSQTEFDKSLNAISADLAVKLQAISKKKIVVLYVTDINKTHTTIGKYIADNVSVDIVNTPGNLQVFDRENLDAITGARKLIAEGYIDASKAKELGQLLSVDVIVIGSYAVLSNSVRLTLKALDASSGFVIAASGKDLPFDADARALLLDGKTSPDNTRTEERAKPQETKVVNTEPVATTGTIVVNNKLRTTLTILLGTETPEPGNFGKKYFELTIGSGNSDDYEGLQPGEYYLCAVFSRQDFRGCVYSKRIIVQAGKTSTVNINSVSNN